MPLRVARNFALIVLIPFALLFAIQSAQGRSAVLSRWGLQVPLQAAQSVPGGLVGRAEPLAGNAVPVSAGTDLAAFNASSALQESAAGGQVEFYRRAMPNGGELAYVVAQLDERVHVELINADGATPSSDETGDTIWADRQKHLATVAQMANAPYAARDGFDLLAAMAFGFHGAERTSNEGSVVINGQVLRVNAGRGALCITSERRASLGLFGAEALRGCQQAVGGGPMILWQGKVVNPEVAAPNDEFVPFNPLGEDFAQLAWRIKIYTGTYPKTAICVGETPGGNFLVLANSVGVVGVDLARALRDMGCQNALGGDDDTSTQATWRGQPIWGHQVRQVPDAIGVYVRR